MNPLLSVVVPCHNEEAILAKSAAELIEYLSTVAWSCGLPPTWELILVNDGSTDGTLGVIEALAAVYPNVISVSYNPCGGQGKALQAGFSHSRGEWIISFDADLDYRPRYISEFLQHAVGTGADIVIGSPYLLGGGIENCPRTRLLMSRAMNWYFRRVFDLEIDHIYRHFTSL